MSCDYTPYDSTTVVHHAAIARVDIVHSLVPCVYSVFGHQPLSHYWYRSTHVERHYYLFIGFMYDIIIILCCIIVLQYTLVQPGETLPINLLAIDQVGNSREAVWSLEAPQQEAVSHTTYM